MATFIAAAGGSATGRFGVVGLYNLAAVDQELRTPPYTVTSSLGLGDYLFLELPGMLLMPGHDLFIVTAFV